MITPPGTYSGPTPPAPRRLAVHRDVATGRSLTQLLIAPADGDWVFTIADQVITGTGALRAVSLHLVDYVR